MSKTVDDAIKEFAEKIRQQAKETLEDFETDLLPYVEEDTIMNAMIQAEDIVRNIVKGNFVWEGDYIRIQGVREYSPSVRIAFSHGQYDQLRDKIIERMPKCPKDAKIAQLEKDLENAYRRWI